jgi:hypothetical protein
MDTLREMYNIRDDLTLEEKEEIKKQTEWLDEYKLN